MKNIVVCFDGTWNTLDSVDTTNVVETAKLVTPTNSQGVTQIVHYDEGVGSGHVSVSKFADRALGGAFGIGLMNTIEDAYRFLSFNYAPGDKIFIFGFSRGAFSARSFGGLIRNSGILAREHVGRVREAVALYQDPSPEKTPNSAHACEFRAHFGVPGFFNEKDQLWRRENRAVGPTGDSKLAIEYLGIWDTVGAMGVPGYLYFSDKINNRFRFHDTSLSSVVNSARHAVAIDEKRRVFDATLWNNIKKLNSDLGKMELPVEERPYIQQWFPGDHGSVGGGGNVRGLCNATLVWVLDGAIKRGLGIDAVKLEVFRKNIEYRDPTHCMAKPVFDITSLLTRRSRSGPSEPDLSDISDLARKRFAEPAANLPNKRPYRPKTLNSVAIRLADPLPANGTPRPV